MHTSERSTGTQRMFGSLLRFHRERSGISQDALAQRIGFSKSQVAMVERGERPPKGDFVRVADEVLGAQSALLAAAKELRVSHLPAWTEEYAEEEAKAISIHMYANHLIPGLLQTEAYAQAIISCHYPPLDDEEIQARVKTRLDRQRILRRKPLPVIGFVLEQCTLSRPLGSPEALKEQLQQVIEVGRLRNVEIQVVPHNRRTHAGLDGPMILLETAERRQLAYIEGQRGGYFLSEQPELSHLFGRYGILRAQALTPEESAKLIEQVAREL